MEDPRPTAEEAPAAPAGRVEAIYVRPAHGADTVELARAAAVPGRGLEGDRYFGDGQSLTSTGVPRDLTLIEAEALEGLREDTGIELRGADSGRNVLTRGVALNDLVGRRFAVGGVECRGEELCEPCRTLERATVDGVLRGLVNRGGLRASVLTAGTIAVGDPIA